MKLLTAAAFALCLLASAPAQTPDCKPFSVPSSPNAPLPKSLVADQPGAPLALCVPAMRWAADGAILDVYIVVRNTGARGVTAYGTRSEFDTPAGKREECHRFNVLSPGKVILTGQGDGKSRFHGVARGAEPKSVLVALDFVEFADGATWGPGVCGTAEKLAAERAGGRRALGELRRLLKSEGPQAVADVAVSCEARFRPPDDHPRRLIDDYLLGVRTVCGRVRSSFEQEGLTEIGATLRKPYDAADREAAGGR